MSDSTHPLAGLSDAEAAMRLRADGPNELPSSKPRRLTSIAIEVIREPMFMLLIASGAVYLVLGDAAESAALLVAVFLVIGITLYQEQKTERALQALRDLSSPRALVIRGGTTKRIAGRDVVRDDLVVLHEGDRVPADGCVESCSNLRIDESLLTGESVPVRKTPLTGNPCAESPGGDNRPFVYSGTLIVSGDGIARVTATGLRTELGKIGEALKHLEAGPTSLQLEVGRMVRLLATLGLTACVVLGVAYGLAQQRWLDGALAGLTLAIAMVPEEFPVILTVFLALGAWRISRSQVLTRRMPAIETLGSATVLCVDKTGTLTMNRMSVAAVAIDGRIESLDEGVGFGTSAARVIAAAIRASKTDAFDPMERAFRELGRQLPAVATEPSTTVREYPLSDSMLAVTHVWRNDALNLFEVAVKGAPESVVELCRLDESKRARVLQQVEQLASQALRVLGVAVGEWRASELPASPASFDLQFLGLVGLADPVRPGVPAAIENCRTAQIRVVMITGDYPGTAMNVAKRVGLLRSTECLTGADLNAMNDDALRRSVRDVDVFARIVPDQKLRIVNALKASGEVVAMTGDGVNDAPALKAADIGVAMGGRGTDVAREAAALVLLDDDFSSIVRAVKLGRRIYDNIEKATSYVLAIHVPIAGISLLPVLLGWPLVLMPVHVIFMELIVDPACSIAFEMEPAERDVMQRPPRARARRLFTPRLVARSLLQGTGALGAALAVWAASVAAGLSAADVRTLTFASLIVGNLALIVANRSLSDSVWANWRTPNPALAWLFAGVFGLLGIVLYVPLVRGLFGMAQPHVDDTAVIMAAGLGALLWMEAVKRAFREVRPAT